ncbi:hypothetical protein CR513_61373, partial [Mucuna pruriens]
MIRNVITLKSIVRCFGLALESEFKVNFFKSNGGKRDREICLIAKLKVDVISVYLLGNFGWSKMRKVTTWVLIMQKFNKCLHVLLKKLQEYKRIILWGGEEGKRKLLWVK